MKKTLTGLALLFSLTAMAGIVAQAKLDRINDFIAASLGPWGQYLTVEVVKATQNNQKEFTTVDMQLAYKGEEGKLTLDTFLDLRKVNGKKSLAFDLNLKAPAKMLAEDEEERIYMVNSLVESYSRVIDAVNDMGNYKAAYKLTNSEKGTTVTLTLSPLKGQNKLAVKSFSMKVFVSATLNGKITGRVTGSFNPEAGNVSKMQKALTNIMNSMSEGLEPSDEDMQSVGEVWRDMTDELNDLLNS